MTEPVPVSDAVRHMHEQTARYVGYQCQQCGGLALSHEDLVSQKCAGEGNHGPAKQIWLAPVSALQAAHAQHEVARASLLGLTNAAHAFLALWDQFETADQAKAGESVAAAIETLRGALWKPQPIDPGSHVTGARG